MQINGSGINAAAINGGAGGIELQAMLTLSLSASAGIQLSKPLSTTASMSVTSAVNLSLQKPLQSTASIALSAAADLKLSKFFSAQAQLSATVLASSTVFDYEQWISTSRRTYVETLDHFVAVAVDDHFVSAPQKTLALVPVEPRAV